MKRTDTPSMRRKSAAIYRDAAAYLFHSFTRNDWGCCDAINQIATGDPCSESREKELFEEMFKPVNAEWMYWGNGWSESGYEDFSHEVHNCRVLALCFMAAMVEAQ